jgi:lyso-ornithine lipid O-acyltransferase
LLRLLTSITRSLQLVAIFAFGGLELALKRPSTRPERAEWLHQFCARAVRAMGIEMRAVGRYPEHGIVISNHLGYLDIMVFAALHRCVFISKSEIRSWPFLGWMTAMSGTVFVERGRAGSALSAGERMKAAADAGIPVVFFPEGTTSNAESVRKFHSGLIAQAMLSGQPITAAHVRYRLTQDNGPGVSIADTVCYWDDTPLLKHIFRLLAVRGIAVEVRFADAPIVFSEGPARRKMAAIEARDAVLALRAAAYGDAAGAEAS